MKKLFLLCVVLSLCLFGCGDQTSGTLSVSAPSASGDIVTATASFAPSTGSDLSGQPIKFRWYTVGVTTKTLSSELAETKDTNNAGKATSQYTLPVTRTESYRVYVTATTGDLSNIEGWQSVQVDP